MADVIDTQLIVLGAGPGGYASAFLAADKGMKVTLIDAAERPDGTAAQQPLSVSYEGFRIDKK